MPGEASIRAARNTILNAVRFGAVLCANVATSALVARALGPDGTGSYSFAIWLAGLLGLLASIGLPATLTRFIAELLARDDLSVAGALARRLVWFALAAAAGVALLGALLALFFLHGTDRVVVLLALCLVVPQSAQLSCTAALAGYQRYDRIAVLGLEGAAAQIALVSVAWLAHAAVAGMLLATLGGVALWGWLCYRTAASLWPLARGTVPAGFSESLKRAGKFWGPAAFVVLLDAIVWQQSEILFLKWFSSLSAIAFYSLAFAIAGKVGQIANLLTNVLLPIFSERFGRSGLRELWSVYRQGIRYVQLAIVPACFYGIVLARPAVLWIYGGAFLPAVPVLQILFAALAFTCLGTVASTVVLGAERPGFIAWSGVPVALLNIGLDLALIPRAGALGAAAANCAAQVAGVVVGLIYVHYLLRRGFPWASSARILLAAAAAAAPLVFCQMVGAQGPLWLAAGLLGGGLYLAVLLVSGEVGSEDWRLARAIFAAPQSAVRL